MKGIKQYYFSIDLKDCKKLYDYEQMKYLYQPSGGWDFGKLREDFNPDDISDEFKCKQKQMDCIHSEGKDQDTTHYRESGECLPPRILPVFRPGNKVKGKIVIELTEILQAKEVKLKLKGVASNCSTEQDIYHDIVCEEEKIIWKSETDVINHHMVREDSGKINLFDDLSSDEKFLAPGKHEFEFFFRVPHFAKPSIPQMCLKSIFNYQVHLSYYLKSAIVLQKENLRIFQGIWVEYPYDIAEDPDNVQTFNVTKTFKNYFGCCGNVDVKINMPSKAFTRLSDIKFAIDIDNKSDTDIQSITAKLRLKCGSLKHDGHQVIQEGTPAGQRSSFSMSVPFDFTEKALDRNVMPVGTLDYSGIVQAKYSLAIQLERGKLHRNIDIIVPILIGSHDSRQESDYI